MCSKKLFLWFVHTCWFLLLFFPLLYSCSVLPSILIAALSRPGHLSIDLYSSWVKSPCVHWSLPELPQSKRLVSECQSLLPSYKESCRGILQMGVYYDFTSLVLLSPLSLIPVFFFPPVFLKAGWRDYWRNVSYWTRFLYTLMAHQLFFRGRQHSVKWKPTAPSCCHPFYSAGKNGLEELQRNEITTHCFSRTFTSTIWSLMNNICHNCQNNWTKDTWGSLMHFFSHTNLQLSKMYNVFFSH